MSEQLQKGQGKNKHLQTLFNFIVKLNRNNTSPLK